MSSVYPGAYDNDPTVVTGQSVSSTNWNLMSTGINNMQSTMGLLPQGSYATMGAALAGKLDLAGNTMTGAISMGSNKITNLATPTTSTDAATKAYVDAAALGSITIAPPVQVCSTTNQSSLSGLLTIDGVTLTAGNRVLLVGQTTASQNGLWSAASGAWSRTADTLVTGQYTLVLEGTTQEGNGYVLVTTGTITPGTTNLTYNQYNQPGTGGATSGANNNITSMTALTGVIQAPTEVADVNGNAVLQFGSTASAVNSLNVVNAATGNGPQVVPAGSDTNITLNLNTKGTGIVAVGASAQITANGSEGLLLKGTLTTTGSVPATGLLVWYKADAITGFTSGANLTSWTDSSGNSNTATAATGQYPVYYTNILNGLPAVYFNGTNEFMTLTTALTTVQTVFWVLQETVSSPSANAFLGSGAAAYIRNNTTGAYWGATANSNVLNGILRLNGAIVGNSQVAVMPQGAFQILSLVQTGSTGVDYITANQGVSSQSWNGYIAEILIYNSALSDANRSAVEAYLASKYNLPVTVTSGPNLVDIRDPGNNPVFVVTGAGGQQVKTNIIPSGSTYNVYVTDYIVIINKITGSATAVNLPSSPGIGQVFIIKDGKGDAATNNITITPSTGTIDGASTVVISTNYGVSRLVYNGSNWNAL